MAILISFDIDGTMEIGDPPGPLTMDMARNAQKNGFLIGSCSDRPPSAQRAIWEQANIVADFVIPKHMLADVKANFEAERYFHIGDREDLDRQNAIRAGFEFLWPDEAASQSWFYLNDDPNGQDAN